MFFVVLALVLLPGLLVLLPLGLRGWRLVTIAPAVTFGLVAIGGPALDRLGIRWTVGSFAGWTVLVAAVLAVASLLWRRSSRGRGAGTAEDTGERPAPRARWEHLVAAAGVALGMAVGALVFLRGTGGLTETAQDWDAVFHANAVRWIAEHGRAVPQGMGPIANIGADDPYYYPVTFHSLLALVVQQFGTDPATVLNAASLAVVLLWPLGIAALGLAWRLPAPVVAVAAAASTWFTAFPYDSLWRGPLWPYVTGLAMLPGVLAAGRMLIERGPALPTAVAVALGVTGVVAMHPSIAFIVLVYAAALVLALVLRLEPVRWRVVAVKMVLTIALTGVLVLVVLLPARSASAGVQAARWDEFATQAEGFGQVLLFSPVTTEPQWWLGVTALAGLVVMVRRRRLLWLVAAYLVFGAAYAGTASMDNELVNTISGPFYNDAWRFAALLPLAGAFGVGEAVAAAGTWISTRARSALARTGAGEPRAAAWAVPGAATVAVLAAVALLGNGAYVARNVAELDQEYADGPAVSAGEEAAYAWLADNVQPGEAVMNDRHDGSAWMYAKAGVEPLEFNFFGAEDGTVVARLCNSLNQMDDSRLVRRLLREEHVRYVIVGEGFVMPYHVRAPGLEGLDQVQGLRQVFSNDAAVVYEVVGADEAA